MNGLQRHVRRAVLARLKGHAPLASLVLPGNMHGQTVPANVVWPFLRLGTPQSTPITATCLNGAEVRVPLDAFAGMRMDGGAVVEFAEDNASRIGEEIENALHLRGMNVDVGDVPIRITLRLSDMRLFRDGAERDAFHYSALVNALVFAE